MRRKALNEAAVRRNYSFSRHTIENMEWLINKKIVRNETEAIDLAIQQLKTMYEARDGESLVSVTEKHVQAMRKAGNPLKRKEGEVSE